MIKAIESEIYKVAKNCDYDDNVFEITVKETENSIIVYKSELKELIDLLNKAMEIIE